MKTLIAAAAGFLFLLCSQAAAQSTVVFYRPHHYVGGPVKASVHIDGALTGKVKNGKLMKVTIPAGPHTVCADRCDENTREYQFEDGKTYYFRVDMLPAEGMGFRHRGGFKTVLVPPEIGSEETLGIREQ